MTCNILSITDVGKVRSEFKGIDNSHTSLFTTFDSKREHTSEPTTEVLLCIPVGRVGLKTRVRDPADLRVRLQPPSQSKSVASVTFYSQVKGLKTLDKLECSKWVQTGAEVTEDLNAYTNREGNGAKDIPEFESVVTFCWFDKLWESCTVLTPIKSA